MYIKRHKGSKLPHKSYGCLDKKIYSYVTAGVSNGHFPPDMWVLTKQYIIELPK